MTTIYFSHIFGLVHGSSLTAPKTLGSSYDKTIKSYHKIWQYRCLVINAGDLWSPPKGEGWLPRGSTKWLMGWNFRSLLPCPPTSGEGKRTEVESVNNQWFSQSWLCNEASMKSHKDSFLVLFWRASMLGEPEHSHMPYAIIKSGSKFHEDRSSFVWDLARYISLSGCWFTSFIISFNELVNVSVSLSSVTCFSKLI